MSALYPFNFELGDTVKCLDGIHAGKFGTIKALELRATGEGEKRIATVQTTDRTFIALESALSR